MKVILAAGLFLFGFGAFNAHAGPYGEVLPDNTKLLDIVPGSGAIEFSESYDLSLQGQPYDGNFLRGCEYFAEREQTIPSGTQIRIADMTTSWGEFDLAIGLCSSSLITIDCGSGELNPFTSPKSITVANLRQAFGGRIVVKGRTARTSEAPSERVGANPRVACPDTSSETH